jgi:hypothetical protein
MEFIMLRTFERLLSTAIGGLSIYLGYRLFLKMPSVSDGEGKIKLPGGISIFLSRVGPGIFFALFGASILVTSIYSPLFYSRSGQVGTPGYVEHFGGMTSAGGGSVPVSSVQRWDSLQLSLDIEFLNSLPSLLRSNLSDADRRMVEARVERGKLVIMSYVWEPSWGSFDDFRRWVDDGEPEPVPPALRDAAAYYRQGGNVRP